jgi:hypothetical protein
MQPGDAKAKSQRKEQQRRGEQYLTGNSAATCPGINLRLLERAKHGGFKVRRHIDRRTLAGKMFSEAFLEILGGLHALLRRSARVN